MRKLCAQAVHKLGFVSLKTAHVLHTVFGSQNSWGQVWALFLYFYSLFTQDVPQQVGYFNSGLCLLFPISHRTNNNNNNLTYKGVVL